MANTVIMKNMQTFPIFIKYSESFCGLYKQRYMLSLVYNYFQANEYYFIK